MASGASHDNVRWELVLRISESQRFSKSLRLKEFLLYVCRAALDSHVQDISEQKIGERVFHRPPDYNPNEDNIVRSQARLLRQKLEAYFATEGLGEPVILRIPKGAYVPEFVDRPSEPVATPPVAAGASLAPSRQNLVMGLVAAVGILSFAVAVLVLSLFQERRAAEQAGNSSPALSGLWSQLLSDKAVTTVVIPDHTFAMIQEATGDSQDLQAYVRGSAPGDSRAGRSLESLFPGFSSRRYTTFEAASTAARVLELAEKFPGRVVVRYARDITPRDLSPGNAVLIGRSATNPWTQLFESKLNFHMYTDLQRHRVICKNSAPQPGEPAEFVSKLENGRLEAYSSVAFVKNPNGGNVLIVEGTASSSQEAAAEFITNDKLLAHLAEKIGQEGGRMPYFDALLQTLTVDGVSREPSMVAYRVLAR